MDTEERALLHRWFQHNRPEGGWKASAGAWMSLFDLIDGICKRRCAKAYDEAIRDVAGVDPAAIHNPYRED